MNRRFSQLSLALVALVLGMVIAPSAMAQDAAPAAEEGPDFSLGFSLDFTTAYYFRGIIQEDQGLIIQPGVEFGLNLYKGAGETGPSSVDFTLGIWNSLHGGPSGDLPAATGDWYEADIYFGISATCGKWTAGLTYTFYTAPDNAFGDIDELALGLSYDDSGFWGKEGFALNPSATIALEIDGSADGGADEGVYLGLGIEPSFVLVPDKVTISIPVVLGLSLDNYYEDTVNGGQETFGYLDIGVVATIPMDFIPAKFGAWEGSVGIHFLFLGDSNEAINSGTDDFEVIATAGISIGF